MLETSCDGSSGFVNTLPPALRNSQCKCYVHPLNSRYGLISLVTIQTAANWHGKRNVNVKVCHVWKVTTRVTVIKAILLPDIQNSNLVPSSLSQIQAILSRFEGINSWQNEVILWRLGWLVKNISNVLPKKLSRVGQWINQPSCTICINRYL
jgi:hypothetical protein